MARIGNLPKLKAVVSGGAVASLLHAYTSHAGAVTAFLSDSEATRPGHEMADFVPFRYDARPRGDFRFRQIASRDLASV